MVPEEGIEPTRALSPPDFESGASASFTTPALEACGNYINKLRGRASSVTRPRGQRSGSAQPDPRLT